jgi:CubicO group peptidase (beta-lactamase class C family)
VFSAPEVPAAPRNADLPYDGRAMAPSRRSLIFVSLLVSQLFLAHARAQDVAAPAEFAAVRAAIEDGIAKQLAPSCAVAVIRGGEIVWAEGFGWCDPGRKTRATADSVYLLASVSKPLTATALMLLSSRRG